MYYNRQSRSQIYWSKYYVHNILYNNNNNIVIYLIVLIITGTNPYVCILKYFYYLFYKLFLLDIFNEWYVLNIPLTR